MRHSHWQSWTPPSSPFPHHTHHHTCSGSSCPNMSPQHQPPTRTLTLPLRAEDEEDSIWTDVCPLQDRQAKELPGTYKMGVRGLTSLSYLIMFWWREEVLAHTHTGPLSGLREIVRFYIFWSVFWGSWGSFSCICKLPSLIRGFRLKSTMYGALASGLGSSHVW